MPAPTSHTATHGSPADQATPVCSTDAAGSSDRVMVLTDADVAELVAARDAVRRASLPLLGVGRSDFPLPTLGPALARLAEELDARSRPRRRPRHPRAPTLRGRPPARPLGPGPPPGHPRLAGLPRSPHPLGRHEPDRLPQRWVRRHRPARPRRGPHHQPGRHRPGRRRGRPATPLPRRADVRRLPPRPDGRGPAGREGLPLDAPGVPPRGPAQPPLRPARHRERPATHPRAAPRAGRRRAARPRRRDRGLPGLAPRPRAAGRRPAPRQQLRGAAPPRRVRRTRRRGSRSGSGSPCATVVALPAAFTWPTPAYGETGGRGGVAPRDVVDAAHCRAAQADTRR